jgi:hypothetical protein
MGRFVRANGKYCRLEAEVSISVSEGLLHRLAGLYDLIGRLIRREWKVYLADSKGYHNAQQKGSAKATVPHIDSTHPARHLKILKPSRSFKIDSFQSRFVQNHRAEHSAEIADQFAPVHQRSD